MSLNKETHQPNFKPYNYVQIICIIWEYLISWNYVQIFCITNN